MTVQLYVGRLRSRVGRNELLEYFSQMGGVSDARVYGDYGFIYLSDTSVADKILSTQHEINGEGVTVEEARGGRDRE
jgi:RNA recognition motif. (a.k.a. RRM, RBD, or RNP domain)